VQTCPRCGRENPEGARFCNSCGAELAAEELAGVRKTVTVLFCDLVGSTSLGDRADPELLRELMARYHAELRTILERHGGTVEKFVGDAAMAVFGIPQVHEDDALRAVRAADEILGAVAGLGLEVRIGLNTGEVVAGRGETLVTGDAVNVAARLEQTADAGEILLGSGTHALVRNAVQAEPVEPVVLKGKAEPVPAYRLTRLLPDIPAFARRIETPFVGRGDALEALQRALYVAIDERSPQLATIVGPPGIGKSRLARELIAASDARYLVGRCLSYGEGITYWPLAEVVAQVGDVGTALRSGGDAELAAARIEAALGSAGTAASSEEIAWGFRRLFEELARERPLIVVLDDIHWAEPTLLELVDYLATFARDAPLLLLCMARPDLFELRPGWATPKPNAMLVTLEPLAERETERLVEALRDVADDSKSRIVEAAEGNPLFVEQLVAMQAETGDGAVEIPPTIQALLAARIDRLGEEERSVVERASIEGRLFHRGSVAALLAEHERDGVGAHLLTLVRKEFIRPDRSLFPGDDGFRFGHILIRDAAYDSMPKRLRAELHERFADWLAANLGDDASDEILGYHLEQAHGYRIELGRDDDHTHELALRAGSVLAEAGRRADARLDAGAARSLLQRATALLPAEHPELPALLATLAEATLDAGDFPLATEIARHAQAAAAAAGERGIQLRARMTELDVTIYSGSGEEVDAILTEAEQAIAELERLDDPRSLERAWHLVTVVASMWADFALLERASAARLDVARRAGLRGSVMWAGVWLTLALTEGPTPVEEALPRAESVLADFPNEHSGEFHLALLYAFAGRQDEAKLTIERARRALLELGYVQLHAGMSMNAGWIAQLGGDPARAEDDLRAGAQVLDEAGERGLLSTVAATLADVLYELGRDDEALEWTDKSKQACQPEDILSHAMWRSTRAKLLAKRGKSNDALQLSAEAVEWARKSDGVVFLANTLTARGEVLQLVGSDEQARAVLEEAIALYERKGVVPAIERTRALLRAPRAEGVAGP
jgi:class 3 adenylate cyclase/tetratricopeptide (TPR) repeat protein